MPMNNYGLILKNGKFQDKIQINVSDLSSEIYILKLIANNKIESYKIIKK